MCKKYKMATKRIFTYIVLIFVLSSCNYALSIKVDNETEAAPIFTSYESVLFFSHLRPIINLDVYEINNGVVNYENPIWSILNKGPNQVSVIKYGLAPEGYEVLVIPEPFVSGNHYEVRISSSGGVGSYKFKAKHITRN